jgi:hypothetical protein
MNVARWACVPSFLQLFLHQRSATITTLRWFHDFCISHAEPRPSFFRFGLDLFCKLSFGSCYKAPPEMH